jgi:hypothetical protein
MTRNGVQLTKDLLNVQRAAKIKGTRLLTKSLTVVMRRQVEKVLELFESSLIRMAGVSATRQAKAVTITVQADQHSELWVQALNQAFRILGKDAEATIQPVMQSVADDIHEKSTMLLTGGKPSVPAKRVMQQSISEIAKDVSGINKTTQSRLARLISKGIDGGKSPGELMEEIRTKIPQIATNRVPTIVRTELGRAADRAAIRSMKDSGTVTHVSVSGCEAIEQGIPTFRGTPTCNIKNVPIEYSGDLQFHINHTGALTASGFRQENGSTPSLPLKGGEGIGTWEDRGRPVPAFVSDGGPPKPPKPPEPPQPPAAPIAPKPLPPTPPLPAAAPMVPVKPKPTPKPKPVVAPKPTPAPVPIPAVVDPVPAIAPTPVLAPIIPDPVPATPFAPPVASIADSSPTPSPSPAWSTWSDVDEFNKSLTQKQKDALQDYVGDSRMVNDPLRRGTPLRSVDAELIDDLDNIFAKAPAIPKGTKVYRVIDEDDFESFYSGKNEWVDKGFVSTSSTAAARDALIDELAERNLKPVVLEIEMGEGMSGLPLWAQGEGYFAYQKEVLLPRGRRFVFLGKEGDVVKLRVEVDDVAVIPAPIVPDPVPAPAALPAPKPAVAPKPTRPAVKYVRVSKVPAVKVNDNPVVARGLSIDETINKLNTLVNQPITVQATATTERAVFKNANDVREAIQALDREYEPAKLMQYFDYDTRDWKPETPKEVISAFDAYQAKNKSLMLAESKIRQGAGEVSMAGYASAPYNPTPSTDDLIREQLFRPPVAADKKLRFTLNAKGVRQSTLDEIKKGVELFERMIPQAALDKMSARGITVQVSSSIKRGSYNNDTRMIKIAADGAAPGTTIMHELGHALENTFMDIKAEGSRYLYKRAGGKQSVTRKGRGTERYFKDEWEKRGGHIYTGRDYGRLSNEILTMGIERMLHQPSSFLRDDPEHFAHVLKHLNNLK